MFRDKERYGQEPTTVLKSKSTFNAPLKWKEPKLIFTCSWSDWFIEEADEWRPEAWEIIKATPQHTYQILTKRPERIAAHLPDDWGRYGYSNVWLGISAENQKEFDKRAPILANTPAWVRFVSAEPLIDSIDFSSIGHAGNAFEWVVIGGESGNENGRYGYRPMKMEWVPNLVESTAGYHGIKIFIKQLGTHLAKELGLKDRHGADMTEWPPHLQLREIPER